MKELESDTNDKSTEVHFQWDSEKSTLKKYNKKLPEKFLLSNNFKHKR